VSLSVVGAPQGLSVSFSPSSGQAGFVSILGLVASSGLAPNDYTIDIVATSAQVKHDVVIGVTVQAPQPSSYVLTVSAPTGGGTIQPAPSNYSFPSDQLVTVTAQPQSGWRFDHWTVNGVAAGNGTSLSFILTGDTRVEGAFSILNQPGTVAPPTASVSILSDSAAPAQVMVDGAQYLLPVSFSWVIGSTHQLTLVSSNAEGTQTKVVFSGWKGSVASASQSVYVTPLGDMQLVASYQEKDLVSVSYITSGGIPVAPSSFVLQGPSGFQTIAAGSAAYWLDANAKYTLVSAEVMGVDAAPLSAAASSFVVSQPGSLTIPLSIYSVQLKFVDFFNQPIKGASVVLTTEGGQSFTAVTGADGVASFNTVPFGWFSATYSYLGLSGGLSSTAVGPHFETVTMALSYPLLTVAAVFAGAVAISLLTRKRWRRGGGAALDGYSLYE
jgi:Divergent InlB B-repeat domain